MKDETGGIAIAEFVGLNFYFLVLMTKYISTDYLIVTGVNYKNSVTLTTT